MHPSPQSQAVMLLTVSLGKSDTAKAKPLSSNEWARFANWLKDHELEPSALLRADLETLLGGWMDRAVPVTRVRALLDRGAALGLALEKWERAGLWAITRSDSDYPERLKRRLRAESPAVLFGCGNKALLNAGGVAVVGSRDAAEEDLVYTKMLGEATAAQGYSIVSGGARGVDESAMRGALDVEGTAVGILADSLIKSATSAKYRKHILSDDLVLVTPFNPEAGFNVGNAMSRNRYIYCLADTAIVISSTVEKGGTWNGALENLKHAWVPLWVKQSAAARSGNSELVRRGAHWLPADYRPLLRLLRPSDTATTRQKQDRLPNISVLHEEGVKQKPNDRSLERDQSRTAGAIDPISSLTQPLLPSNIDLYTLFLTQVEHLTSASPLATEDIAARLDLQKSQVNVWLKRAVSEGKIAKSVRPVRYRTAESGRAQGSLFGEDGCSRNG